MLEEFRKEIDECDKEIMRLLKKRMNICKNVGLYKKENNLPIYNKEREEGLLNKLSNMANSNLSEENIVNIYKEILSASKELQNKLLV